MKRPQHPASLSERERLTARDYLHLRRERLGWSRPLDMNDRLPRVIAQKAQLSKQGFDSDLLIDLFRSSLADPETQDFGSKTAEQIVDELSLQLIEVIDNNNALRRRKSHASARTGQVLPDSLINDIALELVEFVTTSHMDMPHGLLSLLQIRLDPRLSSPISRANMETQKNRAIVAIARDPSISTRELAKFAGINQSTASRWKNDPHIQRQAQQLNPGVMHK